MRSSSALGHLLVAMAVLAVSVAVPAQDAPNGKDNTGKKILLVGERAFWGDPVVTPTAGEMVESATSILKGSVESMCERGQTVAALEKKIDSITKDKPTMVIVFAGAADQKAETDDDTVVKTLTAIATKIKEAGIDVYLIPSSPSISAGTSADLRLAATAAGATYIEPGNEIDGRPYEEAFENVVTAMKTPSADPEPKPTPKPEEKQKPVMLGTQDAASTDVAVTTGESATIYMPAPPPLKQFDPKSRLHNGKRGKPKKPAVAD
jgi:hypothetical protein